MIKPAEARDESDLARFGYAQSLGRSLGGFSSFAAGFAYISILTGLFQMIPMGYRAAGPSFIWTWPVVALGQICVALGFAELSAHYPLCGSVYQWGKQVGSPALGWFAGWISLAGSIAALAAVAMALQTVLPVISPVFQVIGHSSNPEDSARNAVILGSGLILLTTLLNARAVSLMAKFNNLGVIAEIIGAVSLVALLFMRMRHSPAFVLGGSSRSGPILSPAAYLTAALTASYVLYGFETAGSLAEETVEPRKKSPWAILHAILSASILGGLLILSGLMASRDPFDPALGRPDGGLASIVTESLGPVVGKVFLVIVAIAIASCTLAVQTGAIRLAYAMARDGLMPGSKRLAKVDKSSRTPFWPSVLAGFAAVCVLLVNLNHPRVVEAIGSVSVVWINLAYWLVSVALLVRRFRGWPDREIRDADGSRLFALGRFGLPINAMAVIWGIAIVTNTGWPRAEIYGDHFPQRQAALLGTIVVLAAGGLYYNLARRSAAR